MKIAIAQMNPTIGDLEGNCHAIINTCRRAKDANACLVVFPELSLIGYPPRDLLLRDDFLRAQARFLDQIAKETPVPALVGAAIKPDTEQRPFNAAIMCHGHSWKVVAKKLLLPNYNVFDEQRYFSTPGDRSCSIISLGHLRILLSICEDAWNSLPILGEQRYDFDPIENAIKKHGDVNIIINMSASPFSLSKPNKRELIFTNIAKTYQTPVLVAGQVGANDQLLFDGHSMAIDKNGSIVRCAKPFTEELLVCDPWLETDHVPENGYAESGDLLERALTMGIRDYVEKCGARGILIGLSGGIDSAVCSVLAVKALGHARVRSVFLPSQFSSKRSLDDARNVASNLSIRFDIFEIEACAQVLYTLLGKEFAASSPANADIATQNIQARLRGLVIMGLSNATDYLMIATSNKSELSVGYSTTYGDMCGAFSAIGDLYKGQVRQLAHAINRHGIIIPQSIIDRPPSAELKADQLDSDTMPEYEVLDKILANFIELEKNAIEIAAETNISKALIDHVIAMVNRSEYKRRQAPFCLMVSDKVFGDGRRMPIAKHVTGLD